MKGYIGNIEKETVENSNFRKVLYTTSNAQLVLMSLAAQEEIGEEVHDVDQFFRIEKGAGKVVLGGAEHEVHDGSVVIVPAGMKHNVINTGSEALKLYSLYMPPHHKDGTLHKTKAEAEQDDEHFDGITSQ